MTQRATPYTPLWLKLYLSLGLSNRLMLVIASVLISGSLAVVYSAIVNPLVEFQTVGRRNENFDNFQPPPPQLVNMAHQYLPQQPWAADARYQFRTADAFIYSSDWEPIENEQAVQFTPFAMIFLPRGHGPDDVPVTITSQSAVVRFQGRFDIESKPGRVVGGTLRGDVRISGPDNLLIEGRNFDFSEQASRVWSDHPVRFAYDGHSGSARGVQVDLVIDPETPEDESISVVGLHKITLRQDVIMNLNYVDRNRADKDPIQARIRAAGSFEFQIAEKIATFTDEVQVFRPTNETHTDSLHCDQLTLKFVSPGAAEPQPIVADPGERQGFVGLDSDMEFERLRARGRNVVLISEANNLTAHMTELVYDAKTRVAALTDGEAVRVIQRTNELICPEITLMHTEDGQIDNAWCRGSGWLKHHNPETRELEFAAQWARELRKYREEDSGLEVIELQQQAILRHPRERAGMRAELIKLWFSEQPADDDAPPFSDDPDPFGRGERSRYRPLRLLAMDHVALASPLAQGETDRLELWFAAPRDPTATTTGSAETSSSPAIRPVSQSQSFEPADPAAETAGKQPDSDAKRNPLEIMSDLIQIRVEMLAGRDAMNVTDIWTEGNVQISQANAEGKPPLTVSGKKLRLENSGKDQEVLHIFGEPAHVRDRGFHIEGKEIHLDRQRNLAWVQGTGLLQLPMERDLDGNVLDKPQTLDIWWSDQMSFDGRTGRFFGNVRGVLADNRMRCQEMHVLLTQQISFADAESLDSPAAQADDQAKRPEIYSILCNDGVDFRSYEYESSKLIGIRHARCAHLAINQVTGDTEASGPGWITLWRRGKGTRAALAPAATATANQPIEQDEAEWEYARVDFVGKAKGNMHRKLTNFHDQVRIVYGPVDRPLAAIDPENLPAEGLPKAGGILRADHLQVGMQERSNRDKSYIELLAEGNAFLEGRNFHAQADTISFDESKERYILRSIEPRKATIWRQEALGGDYSGIEAQRMEFSPNRNELKFDRATGLQGIR